MSIGEERQSCQGSSEAKKAGQPGRALDTQVSEAEDRAVASSNLALGTLLSPLKRPSAKALAISIVAGVAAMLLTGLVNVTPSGLVGARWYGLPLTWLRRLIIAPQYFPWKADWGGLAGDLVFWVLVAVAAGWLVQQLRR